MNRYFKWSKNNFGDELNDLIFPNLGYKDCIEFNKTNLQSSSERDILGLGTLLLKKVSSSITVAGSGSDGKSKPRANLNYYFVRGKLTCDFLNISKMLGVGDPAYFLRDYFFQKSSSTKTIKVGIIPHWSSLNIFKNYDNVISPLLPVEECIEKLSQCEMVITESMHGAICADILRIPFAPVKINDNFNEFKWLDWASTMNLNLSFGSLTNYKFYLSGDNEVDVVTNNVKEKLERIKC